VKNLNNHKKKTTSLFIVHRPFHILRSQSIIEWRKRTGINQKLICIVFDSPQFKTTHNMGDRGRNNTSRSMVSKTNSFSDKFNMDVLFDSTLKVSRDEEPSIYNIVTFKQYYSKTIADFKILLKSLGPISDIFFFSDKEKPIEIIVSLARSMWGSKSYLVNEGIVSYNDQSNLLLIVIKSIIVKMFSFKHINNTTSYGGSSLFDYFLTENSFGIGVVNRPHLIIPKISSHSMINAYVSIDEEVPIGTVLYISNALAEGRALESSEEYELIDYLVSQILSSGSSILIKPHPVEAKNKFARYSYIPGIFIASDVLRPVEYYFVDTNISLICGSTSSALLNTHMNKKTVISLLHLFFKNGHPVEKIFASEGIVMPKNKEEFENILRDHMF
jgi:hypothetical protein